MGGISSVRHWGFAGIIFGVWSYFAGQRYPLLTYGVWPIHAPLLQSENLSNLKVFYKGADVQGEVSLAFVKFENLGAAPIIGTPVGTPGERSSGFHRNPTGGKCADLGGECTEKWPNALSGRGLIGAIQNRFGTIGCRVEDSGTKRRICSPDSLCGTCYH
jgi:hypothetical protein